MSHKVTGRFAPESFRPCVISPVCHFALGRFALGHFTHIFILALWIEVRYVLVHKGVEEGRGVGVFAYSSGLFIQYLLLMSFIL